LYARSDYGDPYFDYRVFPDLDQNTYKRLILRNTGQDFAWCYMRDVFMQSLVKNLNFDLQASRISEVFLNGEYWGIHYIREKQSKYYLEGKYNISTNEVDILEKSHDVVEGNAVHYDAMIEFIEDNDMSDPSNYAYLKTQMDCYNYINYAATNIFYKQSDWPHNNVKYWRKRINNFEPNAPCGHDGRWRWFLFDTDYGFGRIGSYDFDMINKILYQTPGWSTRILQHLVGNDEHPGNEDFRNELINTLADLMNTNFKTPRMLTRIDSIKSLLLPKIEEHMERWNGLKNLSQWNGRIDVMIKFAQNRAYYVKKHIVENFETVTDTNEVTLTTNIDNGHIRINKLIINHNTFGLNDPSQPYPWTGTYFQGVPVQIVAIPNPGFKFIEWEGVSTQDTLIVNLAGDTTFTAIFHSTDPQSGEITVNEINYNSPADYDAGSWFEIHNQSSKEFHLNGWQIQNQNGEMFTINSGNKLNAGQFYIFASDTLKFKNVHPDIHCFAGNLPFSLEETDAIKILSSNNLLLDSVNYQNTSPWPEHPYGFGPTLELINPDSNNLIPENWQASYVIAGTPGRLNSKPSSAIRINEFMADNETTIAAPDGNYSDWIEIYNPLNIAVDIAGLYFTDDPDEKDKHQVPLGNSDSTLMPPNSYLLLWGDGDPEEGIYHLDFKLSGDGEFVGIYNQDAESVIDTITFGEQTDDVSYGRFPDGTGSFMFFEQATPKMPNGLNQRIAINKGWSAISSYLVPWDADIESIFSQTGDELIILTSETGIYWPGQNIITLNNWNPMDAFFIKTSDSLNIEIYALSKANNKITLLPGWTLIPCLASDIVSIEILIEEISDDITIIKEVASVRLYWPEKSIFTLQFLEPGKAYMIFATEQCELEFPGYLKN